MKLLMLDTNMVSFALRGQGAVDAKLQALAPGEWCISAVTCSELWFGVLRRPQAVKLRALVSGFLQVTTVLSWDDAAALEHARIRTVLADQGSRIGDFDEMIAGHALAAGAVLVTDNTRHFARVPGLPLENWLQDAEAR